MTASFSSFLIDGVRFLMRLFEALLGRLVRFEDGACLGFFFGLFFEVSRLRWAIDLPKYHELMF